MAMPMRHDGTDLVDHLRRWTAMSGQRTDPNSNRYGETVQPNSAVLRLSFKETKSGVTGGVEFFEDAFPAADHTEPSFAFQADMPRNLISDG